MRLTAHTDYAFRVLIFVGTHGERLVTTEEIANAFGISAHHLGKVVNRLSQHGFVAVKRGRGGGLLLGAEPDQIRLADVLNTFETDLDLVECFRGKDNHCPITAACGLTPMLVEARDAFLEALGKYTLADVLTRRKNAYRKLFLKQN